MAASLDLLSNASATGDAMDWSGGTGVFAVTATWSGATVKLQAMLPDGSTWGDVGANTTLTADGMGGFVLPPCRVRAAVSGGPPSGVYASANKVR